MKIGFDAKRFFFNASGLGNYSRSVIQALLDFCPDTQIFLYVQKIPDENSAIASAWKIIENDGRAINPRIHICLAKSSMPWWRTWGMGAQVGLDGLDVFHGLSNELPLDLPKSIRIICTIHDVIFKEFPGYYPFIDRWIYQWKTRKALLYSDHLILTSNHTKKLLIKYFKTSKFLNPSVVYQSIQNDFFESENIEVQPISSFPYFIYHSSFNERKNHHTLISAFELIQKQTDYNLVLVGLKGNTSHEIRERIASLKLSHRIILIEDASLNQLISYCKGASGFVYPSLSEGFGIPLAEAAACGLPMAVSRIPVFEELAEDAVIYFHPNDEAEMASAMLSLTANEEKTRQNQLRSFILSKMEAENIAVQLMHIYSGKNK